MPDFTLTTTKQGLAFIPRTRLAAAWFDTAFAKFDHDLSTREMIALAAKARAAGLSGESI